MEMKFGLRGKDKTQVPFVSRAHSTVTGLDITNSVLTCSNDTSSAAFCSISIPSEMKIMMLNSGEELLTAFLHCCVIRTVYLERTEYIT